MLSIFLSGCAVSAEQKIAQQQNQLAQQANESVGMPNITEFYEKKLAKEIIELRDDSSPLQNHAINNIDRLICIQMHIFIICCHISIKLIFNVIRIKN